MASAVPGEKLRAWYAHRQGLDGRLAGASAAQVLTETGWARSVGGTGPYLTLFSRAGISREAADGSDETGDSRAAGSARLHLCSSGAGFRAGVEGGREFHGERYEDRAEAGRDGKGNRQAVRCRDEGPGEGHADGGRRNSRNRCQRGP